ncbi:MAG TPA: primosomal protein N', partial [Candidatus Eisenbacteria bacterium]|nr:primosomal protein N' [Candidatus Eisenbacteria bacterium]
RKKGGASGKRAAAESDDESAGTANADFWWLSPELVQALETNQKSGKQSLLFLNRRGYANFLQCTDCGHVFRCSFCSVTLTLHLKRRDLRCHHCDYHMPFVERCPACGASALSGMGLGTEQIESALRRIFPGARIARMDRDTTRRRGSQLTLLQQWERGEIDILIGTQMITKGHDVSGVTLVGAVLADLSLNFPDFRAAERTFQLLSQVAGRSGRGESPGRVIIQTYAADHYAIRHLIDHDYKAFFDAEIEFRRALHYPPYSRLINLRFEGPKADKVEQRAQRVARALRALTAIPRSHSKLDVLGPAPAPIYKLRNRYRWQILLKGDRVSALQQLALAARATAPDSRSVRLQIDVDPYNML